VLSASDTCSACTLRSLRDSCLYRRDCELYVTRSAGIQPSREVIKLRAPHVSTGHLSAHASFDDGAEAVGYSAFDSDEEIQSDSDEEECSDQTHVVSDHVGAEDQGKHQNYSVKDECGLPQPLQSGLLTLSGEPSSRWESLVHLEAIKVRSTF
jgi:hypothetical protein